jgi:Transglycosylase SLT domain
MKSPVILVPTLLAALAGVPGARADYAVMRSGVRLHITAYELSGDRLRLTVAGGTVEVAASDVVSIEPEEIFVPNAPPAPRVTGPFAKLIHGAAQKHGVDESLIQRVLAAESNFNPRAVSRKGALGLMQLLPETAARYSVANVFDPEQNIDAGTRYLRDLLELYRGNLPLALAAYNAGPDMVERYGGIPPFPETETYVQRITRELAQTKGQGKEGPTKAAQSGARNRAPAAQKLQEKTKSPDATSARATGPTVRGAVTGAGSAAAGAQSAEPVLDPQQNP